VAPPRPDLRYARFGLIAYEFPGAVLAGAGLGWLLDRWLGTAPYGALVLTLAAVIGGLARLVVMMRRFDRLDRRGEP